MKWIFMDNLLSGLFGAAIASLVGGIITILTVKMTLKHNQSLF